MQKKIGVCVYCGQTKSLTKDHIPPQNLFPKPRPSNLITVPCCFECNKSFQKDDEYFCMCLILKDEISKHVAARHVQTNVLRSLERYRSLGLRSKLFNNMFPINLVTKSGIYVGKRYAHHVDMNRLSFVVSRIVKGPFYHVKGYRLPDTHTASALVDPRFTKNIAEDASVEIVLSSLIKQPENSIGTVFKYKYIFTNNDPDSSAWLMIFYDSLFTIGVTMKQRIEK